MIGRVDWIFSHLLVPLELLNWGAAQQTTTTASYL